MEIVIKDLHYTYGHKTPFEKKVLHNINMTIPKGSYTAIIGQTGSGKSTLIQHFNGLLKPTSGSIQIGDFTIRASEKVKKLKDLRRKVGLVFQYPEHQLFEETVLKDIIFGPVNFGVSEKVAIERAKSLIKQVGLSEDVLQRSPFALSGGQMRRVAICGVLASMPKVLVLDEPTAGLDPKGQKEIMAMFKKLHDEHELTTILVTHNMTEAALYADQIYVLQDGKIALSGTPKEVFADRNKLIALQLDVPETVEFLYKLEERLQKPIPKNLFTIEEVTNYLVNELLKK